MEFPGSPSKYSTVGAKNATPGTPEKKSDQIRDRVMSCVQLLIHIFADSVVSEIPSPKPDQRNKNEGQIGRTKMGKIRTST